MTFLGVYILFIKSLANNIDTCFKNKDEFTLKEAYIEHSDKPKETARARIYDYLGINIFQRYLKT